MQPVMCLQMVMRRQRGNYRRSSSGRSSSGHSSTGPSSTGHSSTGQAADVGAGLQSQESSLSRVWAGLERQSSAGAEGSAGAEQGTTGSFTSRQSSLTSRQSSLSRRGSLTGPAALAGEITDACAVAGQRDSPKRHKDTAHQPCLLSPALPMFMRQPFQASLLCGVRGA